jgi:hypothetical protein
MKVVESIKANLMCLAASQKIAPSMCRLAKKEPETRMSAAHSGLQVDKIGEGQSDVAIYRQSSAAEPKCRFPLLDIGSWEKMRVPVLPVRVPLARSRQAPAHGCKAVAVSAVQQRIRRYGWPGTSDGIGTTHSHGRSAVVAMEEAADSVVLCYGYRLFRDLRQHHARHASGRDKSGTPEP